MAYNICRLRANWKYSHKEEHNMRLNSGDTAPKTATYKVIGPDGRVMGSVYMREGETLPPTQQSGCHYEME